MTTSNYCSPTAYSNKTTLCSEKNIPFCFEVYHKYSWTNSNELYHSCSIDAV